MKVIVSGAGQVGFGIARQLAAEQNDVTVVDQSQELIQQVSDTLDVRGVVGHGAHPDILDQAGAASADMLIAVTFSDEVNMVACQVAHSLFNVPTKIARIRAQSYTEPMWSNLFSRDHMPIDVIISPELEVGRAVLRRLKLPGAFDSVSFADDHVMLVGVSLDEDCPIINTPLGQLTELFPDLNAIVTGITRGGKLFVPKRDDQMIAGDNIYFIADRNHVTRTLDIFGHHEPEAQRVIILGGGNIGLFVAQQIEEAHPSTRAKVIELDKQRAVYVADRLNRTIVLNGDGLDDEILREAGVREAETFIAVTNDDEVNILASVIAKRGECQRALTLINNRTYAPIQHSLGIDAFINPRETTVSKILKHVRRGRIRGVYSVEDGAAEVIEAEALETSSLVGKTIREIGFPDGILVGAIVRDEEVLLPRGDTQIRTGDRVVLFARRDRVNRVEQMFRVSLEFF